MSNNVDNRVVQMEFDNKQFESGVQTSLKTLDQLKSGLQLEGAAKGLSNLERAGRSFSLGGIADGVDYVASRFSALGVVGITTLANITNSAVNAGKRIVSSLTIDPIKTGFTEYETKMNAIQTILTNTASKGTDLNEVNDALGELNEYADKTIYNFAQMTDNVGKFTAAGISLNDSVTTVKGLANVAAGFGVDATKMASATYQMTQALSAGTVQLMDWKSMEQAGMGGELLKNSLVETAKEMGIVVDTGVAFRDSLKDGWLTTEVFVATMDKMAKNQSLVEAAQNVTTFTKLLDTMKESVQSGWAQTWEQIIGDKDESTKFFTAISNGFAEITGKSADARNKVLETWNLLGGRTEIIQGLKNIVDGIGAIVKPVKEAFNSIFPPKTAGELFKMSVAFKELTEKFKIGEETSKNLKNTFAGLFAVIDLIGKGISAATSAFGEILGFVLPVGDGLLAFTGTVGKFLVGLNEAADKTDFFSNAIKNLGTLLKPLGDLAKISLGGFVSIFESFEGIDLKGLESFSERVKVSLEPFSKIGDFVSRSIKGLMTTLKTVAPSFYKLASTIGTALTKVGENISNAFANADFNSVFELVNGGLFIAILDGLRRFIKSLTGLSDGAGGFLGGITGLLDGVKGSLEAYQSQLKAGALLKIAIAMGILAASLFALSTIDADKLSTALSAMTMMFIELFAAMAVFEKIAGGTGLGAMTKLTVVMLGMSVSILILTAALTKIAKLDWDEIGKGLLAVGTMAAILVVSAKALSANSGAMIKGAVGFILFAVAINVLAKVVEKLGKLDTDELIKGLVGVGVVAAELALFMRATNLSKMGIAKGLGLIALAVAINMLASAVKKFGELDTVSLVKGLGGMAIVLTEVGAFVKLTGNSKKVISTGVGLAILGTAMLFFAKSVEMMGNLSWNELAKGLIGMAGALGIVTAAVNLMPKGMMAKAAALAVISVSLLMISSALTSMGNMTWGEIAQGLIVLAGSLTIIGVALTFMTATIPGAMALMLVAGALAILTPVLATLGSMSLLEIGKGLLALAGVFAIFGVAGLVLAPLTPVLLALSGAMALFGAGILAVGAGMMLFSAGLAALAVSGTAGAAALVLIVTSLVGLIPYIATTLAKGIVEFARILAEGAPIIAKAAVEIILAIMKVLVEATPVILDGLGTMLMAALNCLIEFIPKIVDAGVQLIIGFLEGISDNIGDVIKTAVKVVTSFINGIAQAIPDVIQAGVDLILAFINGTADAIRNNSDAMIKAMENMMDAVTGAGKDVLKASVKGFVGAGGDVIGGFIEGIKGKMSEVSKWAGNIAKKALESAKAVLGIHSPSKAFEYIGDMTGSGWQKGIEKSADKPIKETEKVATAVAKAGKGAYEKTMEWIDERKYYNKLSLKEELKAWEEVQNKYKEGSAERIKIDREVYRVKKELVNEAFNHSLNWIEEQKYYNKLSLADELKAWQNVQARYAKGTDERKKADREVYRLKNELVEKQTAIDNEYYANTQAINDKLIDDIVRVTDEYENAIKSRADTLYNTYGLFDKVDLGESVNGADLITNLKDQITALDSWQAELESLVTKGVAEGLIDELRKMGPQSAQQIKALNSLSTPELEEYVSLWQTKHAEATEQATLELEGMKVETSNKIAELTAQADLDLAAYQEMWYTQLAELTGGVVEETTTMKDETVKTIVTLRTEAEGEISSMTENIQKIVKDVDWKILGGYIVLGIAEGIKANTTVVTTEATSMARATLLATKSALGIHSPSTEFMEVGKFADEGLAAGLLTYAKTAVNASKTVGSKAIDGLRSALSNMSDVVNGDMNLNPTIRPVLDLSGVTSDATALNGLFSQSRGIAINRSVEQATSVSRQTNTGVLDEVRDLLQSGLAKQEVELGGTFTIQTVNEKGDITGEVEVIVKDVLRRESR